MHWALTLLYMVRSWEVYREYFVGASKSLGFNISYGILKVTREGYVFS
jgi:hypothetical protein